jgi:hypothetical protein
MAMAKPIKGFELMSEVKGSISFFSAFDFGWRSKQFLDFASKVA